MSFEEWDRLDELILGKDDPEREKLIQSMPLDGPIIRYNLERMEKTRRKYIKALIVVTIIFIVYVAVGILFLFF